MILFLLIAFLLELVAFFSIPMLAFLIEMNIVLQIISYLILLSIIIGFWGMFMSPKAPKKLLARRYYLVKGIIYVVAAIALTLTFNLLIGLSFIIVWAIDEVLLYLNKQRVVKRG